MQWVYLIAAILGTILPLSQFVPFLAAHSFDMPLFVRQLFQNNVSAFFAMDVIVSSLVVWLFVFFERPPAWHEKSVALCRLQSRGRCIFGSTVVSFLPGAQA